MKKTSPIKPRILVTTGLVLTALVYLVILIDQLKLRHECFPEDGMCNSGNTMIGDIYGSLVFTLMFALPAWLFGYLAYLALCNNTPFNKNR